MGDGPSKKFGLLQDLILIAVANVSLFYLARHIISSLPLSSNDPEKEQQEQARVKAAANLRRLGRSKDDTESSSEAGVREDDTVFRGARKENLVLNQYENLIAMEVVAPEDIPVGFEGS